MTIREYLKLYNISFSEIKSRYSTDYNLLWEEEKNWLCNIENKINEQKSSKTKKAIIEVINILKSKEYFNNSNTEILSIFVSKINSNVKIANRINNFKEGKKLEDGSDLKLFKLFNSIKDANNLKQLNIILNKNLDNFLPHIYSVIKHCQRPNEYPIYYKYWRNIIREVLSLDDDYDSICKMYRTFPIDNRHLNFGTYLGTIGTLIARNISNYDNSFNENSKDYNFLTSSVISLDKYNAILNENSYNKSESTMENYGVINEFINKLKAGKIKSANSIARLIKNENFEKNLKRLDSYFFEDKLKSINENNYSQTISFIKDIHNIKNKNFNDFNIWSLTKKTLAKRDVAYIERHEELNNLVGFPDNGNGLYKSFLGENNLILFIENKFKNYTNSNDSEMNINYPLNTILYGPPGTGKTYNTILKAAQIIVNRKVISYDEALNVFKTNLHERIEFITFHQNYSYEDFIQGLRPDTENDNQLTFERKDGVFKSIADKALKNLRDSEQSPIRKRQFEEVFNEFINPLVEGEIEEIEVKMKKVSYFITAITNKSIDFRKASGGTAHTLSIGTLKKMYLSESVLDIQGLSSYYLPLLNILVNLGKDSSGKKELIKRQNYVIIIDEINRANISRVFGELITLIEPDKRSHGKIPLEARLPSGDPFIVPSNLYIIGTMNTADKSIALLDIALRRRFEFVSMYPLYEIEGQKIYDVEILRNINAQIIKTKGHDFQIGHAYFMGDNKDLIERMNKKIIPLLLEYYMNDEKEVKGILQSANLKIEEDSWPLKISGIND
ncbi:AAA family ATPase [uncultured Maribacter sp.]|uniref:McrB family protein n=1 Tax=uncultured Maribacter sp. TaxID=431308 RepID=UPI00262B4109|nr:AAA family ATPase [uncultured Maribacter sp.]